MRVSMWMQRGAALLCAVLPMLSSTAHAQPTEHDPSVLAKLRDGRLQEISPSSRGRVDLLAVIQGIGNAGCRFDVQSPLGVAELMQRATIGIRSEDAPSLVLLRGHPTYARTQVMIAQHGCDGQVVRQVATNLVRWLENPPVMPPARLLRAQLAHWSQAGFEVHRLAPMQRAALERALDATQVMVCTYRNVDPANNTFTQAVTRVAWHRAAPEGAGAWTTTWGHPLGNMGTLALEACPDTEQDFDAARDAAGAAAQRPARGRGGSARGSAGGPADGSATGAPAGGSQGGGNSRQAFRCRMAQDQLASVEEHGRRRPEDRTADWTSRVEELRDTVRQRCGGS